MSIILLKLLIKYPLIKLRYIKKICEKINIVNTGYLPLKQNIFVLIYLLYYITGLAQGTVLKI